MINLKRYKVIAGMLLIIFIGTGCANNNEENQTTGGQEAQKVEGGADSTVWTNCYVTKDDAQFMIDDKYGSLTELQAKRNAHILNKDKGGKYWVAVPVSSVDSEGNCPDPRRT